MENLPQTFSKSITSLRSYLDSYSISSHKNDGGSTSATHHAQTSANDESYLSDEDDCYRSTTSRSQSIQQSTLSPEGSTTLSPLTLSETTFTSTLSPRHGLHSVEDDLTPHDLIRMLSGTVSSILPSPFFTCDPYSSQIPEYLPRGKSKEWIEQSNMKEVPELLDIQPSYHSSNKIDSTENSLSCEKQELFPHLYKSESSISKKSLAALRKGSHHIPTDSPLNSLQRKNSKDFKDTSRPMLSSLHLSISDHSNRILGKAKKSDLDISNSPQRSKNKDFGGRNSPMLSSLHRSTSNHSHHIVGKAKKSDMDVSNSARKSFWGLSPSRSRTENLNTADHEEKLSSNKSIQPISCTPIQSDFLNNSTVEKSQSKSFLRTSNRSLSLSVSPSFHMENPLVHESSRVSFGTPCQTEHSDIKELGAESTRNSSIRSSRSISISPTFSKLRNKSNLESIGQRKVYIETEGGTSSIGSFLTRSDASSSKGSMSHSSLWNENPIQDTNSTRRDGVFTATAMSLLGNWSPNHDDDFNRDDDNDTYDDDSTSEEETSMLSKTINLMKTFSLSRSFSRMAVGDQLLPWTSPRSVTTYDTRPITEETVAAVVDIDEELSYTPDEFVEVAEIGNAIAIVESELQQTPIRSNKSWNVPGITVVKSEDFADTTKQKTGMLGRCDNKMISTDIVQHFQWFSHGTVFTIVALVFAVLGVFFSLLSRRSTAFVQLQLPLEISPLYIEVEQVGMIWINLCFNTTLSNYIHNEAISDCTAVRLEVNDVGDRLFEMSRAFLSLGCVVGTFLSIFLCTSIYWESINLKPIGLGYLITYFFQSLALLFFDTKLCQRNGCQIGHGGIFCIIASFCWLFTCVATAKMDAYKIKIRRQRRRRIRRELRFRRQVQVLADKILEAKSKDTDPMSSDGGSISDNAL
jgi:hypothetical protein